MFLNSQTLDLETIASQAFEHDKKEAETKVLASQLSLDCQARRSGWWAVNADEISVYSPTQLCGGGTTKSNSNELPISVPLSFLRY